MGKIAIVQREVEKDLFEVFVEAKVYQKVSG